MRKSYNLTPLLKAFCYTRHYRRLPNITGKGSNKDIRLHDVSEAADLWDAVGEGADTLVL